MAPMTPPNSSPRKRRVASPGSGAKTPPLSREAAIPETYPDERQDEDGDQQETDSLFDDEHHDADAVSDGVETHPVQDNGMLSLPSELLEMIASNLLGTAHILSLGLVNKRLGGIIQEAIVRDLIVSRRNITGFFGMLGRHAELLNKVSNVHLGDFGCSHHTACLCASAKSLNRGVLKALGTAISTTTGHTMDWSQVQESNNSGGPVWRKEPAFSLDVLATSCPSIKSVTIQLPEARPFASAQPPRPSQRPPLAFPALNPELLPVAPFQGPALQLFQARLEALTIEENTRWKGPSTIETLESHHVQWRNMGTHIITLANFSRLKRLDIPMGVLGRPEDIIFCPNRGLVAATHAVAASAAGAISVGQTLAELRSKVLPLTLQYLRLRSCNKWTFALLQKINEIPVDDLQLKHVELSFAIPPKHIILQCDAADHGRLNYLRLLTDLNRKGMKVTLYTGSKEIPVDMCKELEALCKLPPFEVWRCSGSPIPFSEWNSEASKQRSLLNDGFRFFLRHADHHRQFLNCPTFDLKLWTKSALFHGIANTRWDPQLQDPNKRVQTINPGEWNERVLGKCAFKRRLSNLLNLDTFQFNIRIEQELARPPKETMFLGASFVFAEIKSAQPLNQHRDTAKKPSAKEDQPKRSKKVERTEPVSHAKTEARGLEDDIERLQLESANNIPLASEFSGALWASVAWRVILQPRKKGCFADLLQ